MLEHITIFANHSFTIEFLQFEDDKETPKDFTGVLRAIITKDIERQSIVLAFNSSNGLTMSENKVIIKCSKSNNKLLPGNYYLDLRDDTDAENSYPVVQTNIKVKPAAK